MLTHYIFVRRDLPIGVLAAMVTHAAGESARFHEGQFTNCSAVVFEAKNEKELEKIKAMLFEAVVEYASIDETSGTYAGQLMAIGVIPMSRERGDTLFGKYQLLKSCLDNQVDSSVSSLNPNETDKDSEKTTTVAGQDTMELDSDICSDSCC